MNITEYTLRQNVRQSALVDFYIIGLILIILKSCYSWIAITLFPSDFNLVGLATFIGFFMSYRPQKSLSLVGVFTYLLLSCGYFLDFKTDMTPVVGKFVFFLPLLTFFVLSKKTLNDVLKKIDIIFFWLISISFVLFLLDKVSLLPHAGLQIYNQYYFINHYYFYLDVIRYDGAFSGFTLEPGYFSLLLICLIAINDFDFKRKRMWIYLAYLICTLSLGGYLLFVIGFFVKFILLGENKKRSLYIMLGVIVFLVIILTAAFSYNGGDNIFVEKIVNRLMLDDELGIVGNDRENEIAKFVIDKYFYSDNVWFGIGWKNLSVASNIANFDACSWRIYVIRFGAVYTCFFLACSLIFLTKTKINYTLTVFVLFWADFWQHGMLTNEALYFFLIYMLIHFKDDKISIGRLNLVKAKVDSQ